MNLFKAAIVLCLMFVGSMASADCQCANCTCGQCDCAIVPRRMILIEIPQAAPQPTIQQPRMIVTAWRGLFGVFRQQVVLLRFQAIYWRWIPEDRDWRVVDWRLLRTEHQRPVCGQSVWIDGDRLRKVRAAAVIETWTCYDPELDDRRILSECRRWKLSK